MANSLTGNCWVVDTGSVILSKTPVYIERIIFWPNAASDVFQLNSYSRKSVISGSRVDAQLATIADTNTMTADGTDTPFSTDIDDGDVLEILASDGSTDNIGQFLCTANATTTVITCAGQLTNETSKTYSLQAYKAVREFYVKVDGTTGAKVPYELDFSGKPKYVQGLIMETLPTSGVVIIYLA